MTEERFCINCKHCETTASVYTYHCHAPQLGRSPVTGTHRSLLCEDVRRLTYGIETCGPDGDWFAPLPPRPPEPLSFWQALTGTFKRL